MKKSIGLLVAGMVLLSACSGKSAPSTTSPAQTEPQPQQAVSEQVNIPEASISTDTAVNDAIVSYITQPSSNPDKVLIRYTVTQNGFIGNGPFFLGDREFFRSLKEQLGDKVEIQLYFSAPFGGTNDAFIGGLQNQTFEVITWPAASFAEYTNAFNPLDTPYLFKDAYESLDLLNGAAGAIMTEKCIADTGLRPIAYSTNGMRELTNNVREVKTPTDVNGLKIRVQANPAHISLVEAWGGTAATVPYAELFTALQQGVVDGQENPLTNYAQMNFAEVNKYFTMTNHLVHTGVLTVNDDWYQSLDGEVREAIDIAAKRFVEYGTEAMHDQEEDLMKYTEGMSVYIPTDEEMKEWEESGKIVWDQVSKTCDEGYWEKVLNACGKSVG